MTEIKFDFSKINIPTASSKVYKDECCLCFDTPESQGGLNVCLNTFLGFCPDHVKLYNKLTKNNVFLNFKKIKHEIPAEELKEKAPTRLAIGVEGGFDVTGENKYKYEELHCLVCLEPINQVVPLPDENLPEKVKMSISGIIGAMSASKKEEVAAWEGDAVVPTKYAEGLKQVNQHNVPRGGWKCPKCDLTENLWMCLTCGEIGCGRRNYDGSGGNNHGVEHHKATGHPLVVKLGTITPEGKADVYSYFEDQMVLDPHLVKHLEFFGINITEMKKTEKTMAELNLDFNVNFDSHRIQESGKDVYGSRFTGLKNLGNSCYLASVMQVLMSIPEFEKRYHDPEFNILNQGSFKDPHVDLEMQLIKLTNALTSGKYSEAKYIEVKKKEGEGTETIPAEQEGVPPKAFKSLIGKGHPEFSTGRQQDALEFLQYVCQQIERAEQVKQNTADPTQFFKFQLEERLQCMASNQVKYVNKNDNVLNLPVPLEKAINKEEYEEYEKKMSVVRAEERKQQEERKKRQEEEKKRREAGEVFESAPEEPKAPKPTEKVVRPHVPMVECIKAFGEPELIEGFYSTAAQKNTTALKTTRFSTFPDYLFVSVRRFVLDGWVPRKLDVFIDNPQELDLSALRAKGLQPGEVELPKEVAKKPEINIDQSIVQGLIEMGFSKAKAEKAAYFTKNAGLENAMMWLFDHEGDSDLDAPLETVLAGASPKPQSSSAKPTPSEELISVVTDLGIPRDRAIFALQKCDSNPERAIDFVFSYGDDIETMMQQEQQQASAPASAATTKKAAQLTDGEGKYELVAFISHIGSSTASGHYVAHIKKNGNWFIFNDRKVSIAENPPFDMGYIYVYARKGRKL